MAVAVNVPFPRLLNDSLGEIRRIIPVSASVSLELTPLSTAEIELRDGETLPEMGWVEMFTPSGSAGIFRVSSPQTGYGGQSSVTQLEHGAVEIGDWLITQEYDEAVTAQAAFSSVWTHYRGNRWQLGTIEASNTVNLSCDHDTVLGVMCDLIDQLPGYMLDFDQTTSPWTVSVRQKPNVVQSEGRLSRNVSEASIEFDYTELCTRLYMEGLPSPGYIQDSTAIGRYGIIERHLSGDEEAAETGETESVEQDHASRRQQIMRVAQAYLEKYKKPKCTIQISGADFSEVTGEPLDKVEIGNLYRLALPDYGTTVEETVISVHWDDIYTGGFACTITLSEDESMITLPIVQLVQNASGGGGGGGGGGSREAIKEQFKKYQTFIEKTDEYIRLLATESEWDELAQAGRVTAFTELTRTSRYVEDSAQMELPYDDWKSQTQAADPTADVSEAAYRAWITANPYAIYNSQYSDATRTERIISKTGINDLGENETLASRVEQTAETLRSEIATSSSALYSTFEQSLSGFRSEVGDTLNGYSATISQSANSIRAEVHNAISDIYARIIEWEGGGAIEVRNGNRTYKQWSDPTTTESEDLMAGDIWVKSNDTRTWAEMGVNDWNTSQLYEWADYRGDEVYVWKNGRWQLVVSSKDLVVQGSRLEVEQQEIWAVVDDDRNNLRAEMSLTASRFYRTLTDTANGLSSTISQTASQIRSEVTNSVSGLQSSITQTASQIRSEVSDTRNNLQSSITQTASQIRGEISDTRNNLQSSITQNANQISLKVSKGDIASTINQTAQSVLISASKINLQGYVTASELDAEKARFDNLTAGTTTATALKATLLQANSNFNLSGTNYAGRTLKIGSVVSTTVLSSANAAVDFDHYHSITVSESDGVITITTGKARASADTQNFNIAGTAFYTNAMSAQWAAARGKVVMPSAGTETTFKVKVPSATEGEQEEKTFTIQKGSTPASSGYASVSLSGTVVGRIDIGDWYTAGKTAAHAEYTYHTGYLRGSSVSVTPIGNTFVSIKSYGIATLYKKNGDNYESVGDHYWYYRSDSGTKYYNSGTTQTYYTSGSYVAYYTRNISQ